MAQRSPVGPECLRPLANSSSRSRRHQAAETLKPLISEGQLVPVLLTVLERVVGVAWVRQRAVLMAAVVQFSWPPRVQVLMSLDNIT